MGQEKRRNIAVRLRDEDLRRIREIAARFDTRSIELVTKLIQFSFGISEHDWRIILSSPLTNESTKATLST